VKIPYTYHSALRAERVGLGGTEYFSDGKSVVFRHDICDGTREEFLSCDCIYVEPAWRSGYETFQRRAGVKGKTFDEYIAAIKDVVAALNKPTFLVGGKHMLRALEPESAQPIRLYRFDAQLLLWNSPAAGTMTPMKTTLDLQRWLGRYARVLDFCCGYGEHLRQFKTFVACDINKKCVTRVARDVMWCADVG
jgi:hypothetical protein